MIIKSTLLSISLFLLQTGIFGQVYDTELPDINGKSTSINELKGEKLTVLDFWATWCKPCVRSIPELVKLSKEFHNKGVHFIGINEDSPRNSSKVRPFATSLGITYPVLMDTDQELLTDLLIDSFPTLVVLDSKGKVIYTHVGYSDGDENIIKEKIEKLLGEMD
jgi:cytochrome c biogenesis protein CcmG, thiol:disulfide interchange protein DsbE